MARALRVISVQRGVDPRGFTLVSFGGAGGMHADELFPTRMALDPVMIAEKIGDILVEEGRRTEPLAAAIARVKLAKVQGAARSKRAE